MEVQKFQTKPNKAFVKPLKPHIKNHVKNGNSLLEKISNNIHHQDKQIKQGKILITKLQDVVSNKCLYGNNCAHLRAQSECHFLHEKKDFQFLKLQLPEKYLQNQQPLKKTKKQRKQFKMEELAQRQKRLQQKNQKQQKEEKQIAQDTKNEQKVIEQKNIDKKQVWVQNILKSQDQQKLTINELYKHMNEFIHNYKMNSKSMSDQGINADVNISEIRKKILFKLHKNSDLNYLEKIFIEKQGAIIKKLIKNILAKYSQEIQLISDNSNSVLDLTQIQEVITYEQIERVMRSKKENENFIEYYLRFFKPEYGFPLAENIVHEDYTQYSNRGNLYPITEGYALLILLAPTFEFSRKFIIAQSAYLQVKLLAEFCSLGIPQKIVEKNSVQKIVTIDVINSSFSKICEQLTSQYLSQYHQKMKSPGQFSFGKLQQNTKKFRNFIEKYKAKVQTQNTQNSFILVIFGIKKLFDKIEKEGLSDKLDIKSLKKDRSMEEQKIYEQFFLLKELISHLNYANTQLRNVKIIYIDSQKMKMKKYKSVLSIIDPAIQK